MIFVNSMSDLFHQDVPIDFIQDIFQARGEAAHTLQVLSERSKRLREIASELEWPENVWMGGSIENMEVAHRADDLMAVPSAIRFLSCEPLLGSLKGLGLGGTESSLAANRAPDLVR